MVSVVTVVKDHFSGLHSTYDSLVRQIEVEWELIVVVGPSDDGTLQYARELEKADFRVRVIEQRGNGIYSAMNIGLEVAEGNFTWFMNAGDRFASPLTLANSSTALLKSGLGLIIGGYQIDDSSNRRVYAFKEGRVSSLQFAYNRRGGCHQSMVFKTSILKDMGGFNLKYVLASDFELVLKIIKKWKAGRVSEVYSIIEPGGRADQGIFLVHREKHQIRREQLKGPLVFISSFLWANAAIFKINIRRLVTRK
jgi:putative colanic acid biosynthesis glycosyltransferase